jgi:hypothetical protein
MFLSVYSIFELLFLIHLCSLSSSYYENCAYEEKNGTGPQLYWINLDRSNDRRDKMQRTIDVVKIPSERIRGLDVSGGHIYLPPDIEKTWWNAW